MSSNPACRGCGKKNLDSGGFCWSCGQQNKLDVPYDPNSDPIPPPELTDTTRAVREFWDYFCATLATDRLVRRDGGPFLIAQKFEDIDMAMAANLMDAWKLYVIDPWSMAHRDAVTSMKARQPELPSLPPLPDNPDASSFVPDFAMVEKLELWKCYGCGEETPKDQGPWCLDCRTPRI